MQLKELVTQPTEKTFRYRSDPDDGLMLIEDEHDDVTPVFEVTVAYKTPGQYRAMLSEAIERKAVSRKGVKALISGEDRARAIICRRTIKGWKLTVEGAYALQTGCDFSGKDPTDLIDFNDENLGIMIKKSQLPGLINDLVTTHKNWYNSPIDEDDDDETPSDILEDDLGNSSSGGSGNLDE